MLFISIHALLAESDAGRNYISQKRWTFLSTLSLRRATGIQSGAQQATAISIHALLAESDKHIVGTSQVFQNFYPRSPCGERLDDILAGVNELLISIHALLAESDTWARGSRVTYVISIHALLAESDRKITITVDEGTLISIHALLAESDVTRVARTPTTVISIHALLAESDDTVSTPDIPKEIFLSTLSLRRATGRHRGNDRRPVNFYPRSPCGERRVHYDNYNLHCVISIHALLAESDRIHC